MHAHPQWLPYTQGWQHDKAPLVWCQHVPAGAHQTSPMGETTPASMRAAWAKPPHAPLPSSTHMHSSSKHTFSTPMYAARADLLETMNERAGRGARIAPASPGLALISRRPTALHSLPSSLRQATSTPYVGGCRDVTRPSKIKSTRSLSQTYVPSQSVRTKPKQTCGGVAGPFMQAASSGQL